MIYALYFIHILISIFLVLVVLLQQGKGADLSVFGGGGTQVAFGARGAATILHKLTVTCFVLFLVTTLTLGIMSARSAPSVMSGVDAGEDAAAEDLDGPAGGTLDEDGDGTGPAGGDLPVGDDPPIGEGDDPPVGEGDGGDGDGGDDATPEEAPVGGNANDG